MFPKIGLATFLAGVALAAQVQAASVESDFDVNSEGWIVQGGVLSHHVSGGNPDGYISVRDNT